MFLGVLQHVRHKYWSTDDFEDAVGTITDVGKCLQSTYIILMLMVFRVCFIKPYNLLITMWGRIKDFNWSMFLFRIAALKVKESSKAEFKKKRTNKKYAVDVYVIAIEYDQQIE